MKVQSRDFAFSYEKIDAVFNQILIQTQSSALPVGYSSITITQNINIISNF